MCCFPKGEQLLWKAQQAKGLRRPEDAAGGERNIRAEPSRGVGRGWMGVKERKVGPVRVPPGTDSTFK